MDIKLINNKIQKIKNEIKKIKEMRPGSLSEQYNVCGTEKCRCKDPEKPQKHGPYYKLSYVHLGKTKNQFIRPIFVQMIDRELREYKKFKELTQAWMTLEIERSNLKIKLEIERNGSKKQKKH